MDEHHKHDLRAGDVVQLDPGEHVQNNGFFAGCFMLVTEVKTWGAQGFVAMPGKRGELPGEAYYRATWDEMAFVGRAAWIPMSIAPEGAGEKAEEGGG